MKLAIITDLNDLPNVQQILQKKFEVKYLPDCDEQVFLRECIETEVIFTNPNNSRFPLTESILSQLKKLKVITTASTGTVHIDREFCANNNIRIISITEEFETLEKISSTAEHALLLTLTLLRRTHMSIPSVWQGYWDYKNFIGRQVNQLSVGTVGLGRLGKMYAKMLKAMGADVYYFDPHKYDPNFKRVGSLLELSSIVDVMAINCHATPETTNIINQKILAPKNLKYLINTARGEIVDQNAILSKLSENSDFYYAADVIDDEQVANARYQFIRKLRKFKQNVVITPHQGGMTYDARELAYSRACSMLIEYFDETK